MTAIFVSHRSADNAQAEALKDWLKSQGHERLFLDFDPADGIPAGVDWEQRLYQELRRCQALLIVLTPAWLGSMWCRNELAIAREKGKAVFIVRVAPCPAGPVIPALQEVDLTSDREGGLAKLARGLKEHGLDPASTFDWKPGRPLYPGLAAFDIEDAAIFFGRSEESWQVVETLRRLRLQATGSPKLLLITGASGSGKSSLMRAGVLARLGKEPASWIVAKPFRRGGDTLGALADAIAWAFPPDLRPKSLEAISARLAGADGARQLLALARELRLALDRPDATLVLALDQAEELLTPDGAEDAARLLELFRAALATVGNEILVLATIRSDRLGGWQQHGSVKVTAAHGELPFEILPLGPMPMARIGEIVRGPAAYDELRIDDDLVDAIRADTATPDALPMLAYTLQYLHRHFGADGRLTLAEYQSFAGLEGSVRSQAAAAIPIDQLSEDDRAALREAFVPGLVRATVEGGFSRSRARLAALPARAEPYLRRLIDDARLLQTDRDAQSAVTVEVAHEALLRVWPTLARWIADDAQKLRRLEALQRAAADWAQSGRGDDFLIHRDHRLSDAEGLVAEPRFGARLDGPDRDYLAACRIRQNEREEQEKQARERELRAAQELAARRRVQILGAIAASVLLLIVAGLAVWQWRVANLARQETQVQLTRANAAGKEAQLELARANAAIATGLWNDLDFLDKDSLAPAELKALWTLAENGGLVQTSFVDQLLKDPARMDRFARNPDVVGRALGLRWPSAQQAEELLPPYLKALDGASDLDAVSRGVRMLIDRLGTEQADIAFGMVLDASKEIRRGSQLKVLTLALPALSGKLSPVQAKAILAQVIDRAKAAEGLELRLLARASEALRPRLGPEGALEVLGSDLAALTPLALGLQLDARRPETGKLPLQLTAEEAEVALMRDLDDVKLVRMGHTMPEQKTDGLDALARSIQALSGQLTAENASGALDAVLNEIRPGESEPLEALASVTLTLVDRLSPKQAAAALHAVLNAIKNASDEGQFHALTPAAQTLAGRLSPEQSYAALGVALDTVKGAQDAAPFDALAPLLETLAGKLTSEDAQATIRPLLEAVNVTEDRQVVALLAIVPALAGKLTADQAQAALRQMLSFSQGKTDELAPALHALVGRLTTEQGQAALTPLVSALMDSGDLPELALTVRATGVPLTAAQGQAALAAILDEIGQAGWAYRRIEMVRAVRMLGVPLTPKQEQAALAPLLKEISHNFDPPSLRQAAQAVEAMGTQLTAEQQRAAVDHLLKRLGQQRGRALQYYLEAMHALRMTLTAEDRRTLMAIVVAEFPRTTDSAAFQALMGRAQALVGQLTAEETQQALASVRPALASALASDKAAGWASVLVTLLPRENAKDSAAEIVRNLKYPTSAGPATDVLLDSLHGIDPGAPGKEAGLAASLTWLKVAYPAIDLDAPPICPPPQPGQDEVACLGTP